MGRPPSCQCGECRVCKHRETQRAWTEQNREKTRTWARRYRERNLELVRAKDRARGYRVYDPEKPLVRRAVYLAIMRGEIQRGPCEVCGTNENVQAHHDDYSKPLDVRWLCTRHHGEVHRIDREEAA